MAVFWQNGIIINLGSGPTAGGGNIMKIFVKVKARAKENKIEKVDENHFAVSVKESPIKGKANTAVIKNFAEYLKLPKAKIRIVSSLASRNKTIEIMDDFDKTQE